MKKLLLLVFVALCSYSSNAQFSEIQAFGESLSNAIINNDEKLFKEHLIPKDTFIEMLQELRPRGVSNEQKAKMLEDVRTGYDTKHLSIYFSTFKKTAEKVKAENVSLNDLKFVAEPFADGNIFSVHAPLDHSEFTQFGFTVVLRKGAYHLVEPKLELSRKHQQDNDFVLEHLIDAGENGNLVMSGTCNFSAASADQINQCMQSSSLVNNGKLTGQWSHDYQADPEGKVDCGKIRFQYSFTIEEGKVSFLLDSFMHEGAQSGYSDHGLVKFDQNYNSGTAFTAAELRRVHADLKLKIKLWVNTGMKLVSDCLEN